VGSRPIYPGGSRNSGSKNPVYTSQATGGSSGSSSGGSGGFGFGGSSGVGSNGPSRDDYLNRGSGGLLDQRSALKTADSTEGEEAPSKSAEEPAKAAPATEKSVRSDRVRFAVV
jgi:hypothetical protein